MFLRLVNFLRHAWHLKSRISSCFPWLPYPTRARMFSSDIQKYSHSGFGQKYPWVDIFFMGPQRPFRKRQAMGISGFGDPCLPFSFTQKGQSRSLFGFITRGLQGCAAPFFFLRKRRIQFPHKRQ
jgi:hypothetical protein